MGRIGKATTAAAIALALGALNLATGSPALAAHGATSFGPTSNANLDDVQLTISGSGFTSTTQVQLVKTNSSGAVVRTINGTESLVSASSLVADMATTGEEPGSYQVRVIDPGADGKLGGSDDHSVTAPGAFHLLADPPSISKLDPGQGPKGTNGFAVKVLGSNLTKTARFAFVDGDSNPLNDIVVAGQTWVSLSQINLTIDIPSDSVLAAVGAVHSLEVDTTADSDGGEATCKDCFIVAAAQSGMNPTVSAAYFRENEADTSETNSADNTAVQLTIEGADIDPDLDDVEARLIGFCPESAPDCAVKGLVAPVTVTSVTDGGTGVLAGPDVVEGTADLALAGPGRYSVQLFNTGKPGGSGLRPDALTIAATGRPTVTSPTAAEPAEGEAGTTISVELTGKNFARGMAVAPVGGTGVSVTAVTTRSSTKAEVQLKIEADAPDAAVDLTVSNTDGQNTTCVDCVEVTAIGPTPGVHPEATYIDAVFRLFLDRPATESELENWYPIIRQGDRARLTSALAVSDEWAGVQVDVLYQKALGRSSDASGRAYWVRQIANGLRLEDVAAFLYGSDEYFGRAGGTNRQFVTRLYTDILGRPGDGSGVDYWTNQLDLGRVSRSGVATNFYASVESRRSRVRYLYQSILGRQPDASGLAYWEDQLLHIGDVRLAAILAASDEHYRRVS